MAAWSRHADTMSTRCVHTRCSRQLTSVHVIVQRPLARQVTGYPRTAEEGKTILRYVQKIWHPEVHSNVASLSWKRHSQAHQMMPQPMQYSGSLIGAWNISICMRQQQKVTRGISALLTDSDVGAGPCLTLRRGDVSKAKRQDMWHRHFSQQKE